MDGLVAWLRAQLDEDEASEWPHRPKCQMLQPVPDGFPFGTLSCNCDADDRWLREVEAKRRILDEVLPQIEANDETVNGEYSCFEDNATPLLQLLALPYADRAGYREEWRP